MTEAEIELRQTCRVSPEQYEAWHLGRRVGYLRLRHGWFSVECPDVGGIEVFEARPLGDGCFYDHEREAYLWKAKSAIATWLRSVEAYCKSPWRPISEAPKDGTPVDVWMSGERHADVKWGEFEPYGLGGVTWTWLYSNHQGYWVPLVGRDRLHEITHFMPLPEPPEGA